jgi:hypothetical protein
MRIDKAGLTSFVSGETHVFLGGTLQAKTILFQNMPEVGEAFCGRIFINGSAQYFWDTGPGKSLTNYTAEVGYILGSGVAPYWRFCMPAKDGVYPTPTAGATASTLSFVYSSGTDKIILQKQEQYKVQLSFKY